MKSMPVMTALTPGSFSAALVSMERMRACGCGLRSTLPDQLAGHGEIGAEPGAARHLVDAIGTDGTGADILVLGVGASV